jgi:predicted dienelactone hydrolase
VRLHRLCVGVVALLAGIAALPAMSAREAPVRVRAFRFVDESREAVFRDGARSARTLVTYVRTPPTGHGPFPLIVFAHGYAGVPAAYSTLLDAWARAGYVVAAPVFPVENEYAPGGPDESDLANQPADMSFVISQLLAADRSAGDPLHGLIDPARIAVAGHSDGAETAFATAYERHYLDPRVRAAVILSGATMAPDSLAGGSASPPLLAVQGTADPIDPPRYSRALFARVEKPKFLLLLIGAGHMPPYSSNRRELAIVERVSIAFLDRYLGAGTASGLLAAGRAPGLARLIADP